MLVQPLLPARLLGRAFFIGGLGSRELQSQRGFGPWSRVDVEVFNHSLCSRRWREGVCLLWDLIATAVDPTIAPCPRKASKRHVFPRRHGLRTAVEFLHPSLSHNWFAANLQVIYNSLLSATRSAGGVIIRALIESMSLRRPGDGLRFHLISHHQGSH